MNPYASRGERGGAASRLTRLYIDTKLSSQAAVPLQSKSASPEKRSFDRKFSIQKDRLIAWGFEWTDNVDTGDIDESVERAGLTEVVESILENIRSAIDDVERMNAGAPSSQPTYPAEKLGPSPAPSTSWMPAELAKYENSIMDMTTAIDLLCNLSRPRVASRSGAQTKADEAGHSISVKKLPLSFARLSTPVPAYPRESSPTQSPSGMMDFQTGQPEDKERQSAPYSIPMISVSSLVLPQEGPPGYGDSRTVMRGASGSPRLFGHVRQNHSGVTSSLLPVMIEYATFDTVYRVPGMEMPCSSRLEQLHSILSTWDSSSSSALARPIAYFEDPEHARYGLVFNRPHQSRATSNPPSVAGPAGQPTTLSTLLHQASRIPTQSVASGAPLAPPLEDRFRLAQQLVAGFRFLQQHDFAHRNVSSSGIAILPKLTGDPQESYDIRRPLICSIDIFSDYDVDPTPENLLQNIYRHPDDPRIKGPMAAPLYDIRYDLYSLSLVLLEVGMWHPLAQLYKDKYSLQDFKVRVEKLWIRKLVGRCGSAYTRCVQDLFDAGSKPDASIDRLQILNRVSARLERCCAIDLEEDETELEREMDMSPANLTDHTRNTTEPATPQSRSLTSDERWDIQRRAPKRTLFQDLELPQEVLDQYSTFEGQVVRITEKILKRSQESCWIDLLYSGENEESARPTICVGCSSTKLVRSALKKYLQYDHSVFDLAVFKDTVRRSKGVAPAMSKESPSARNPGHYQRPLCGSSVGAWRYGEHTAAVSFGGVVLIDDAAYGMTVHHLLEHPDPPRTISAGKSPRRSLAGRAGVQIALPELSESEEDSDEDDDSNDLELDDSDDEHEADEFTDGVKRGSTSDIVLTQPALDDVPEGFFPCKEDEDDEHLLSHRLGHVWASSGLRRVEFDDGIKHEIDWLLMKIDDDRLQPYNVVSGGKSICSGEDSLFSFQPKLVMPICRPPSIPEHSEDLYPRQIAHSCQLPGLTVHCFGRTSGLGTGVLSRQMRWVRFHGRSTFSQVWYVTSAGFGEGGDSGAWVVDSEEGRVCGHVLAWSDKFGVAYVAPMDVMVEDMRRTLGATKIALPGADEQPAPVASIGGYELDLGGLSIEELKSGNYLLEKHSRRSGTPPHPEREWTARRSRLGHTAV